MIDYSKGYAVEPKVAVQFLGRFSPFKELGPTPIQEIARDLDVEFYPKGTQIFRRNITEVTHLHIIQKGGVKLFVSSEGDTFMLKSIGGEGETLGGSWLLGNQKPDVTVEALEDTFCLLLPKTTFLKLVAEQLSFEHFFSDEFQNQRISKAYTETRNRRVRNIGLKRFDYFTILVSDVVRPNFQAINSNSTIQKLAEIMTQFKVGSVLVEDDSDNPVGIVTKKDLRTKVVARGLGYDLPVESIMTSPVLTIPIQARLFEAALRMVRKQIKHLPVTQGNEIVGVITKHDIMVHQATSPLMLLRDIKSIESPESMNLLSRNIPGFIRSLMEEGAKASHCTNVISLLYDRIFDRAMDLIAHFLDASSVKTSIMVLGRAARSEQTFVPVYDYLVVYDSSENSFSSDGPEANLEKITSGLNSFLSSCFEDTLRFRISGANPRWRKPIDVWSGYIDEWINNPIPPEVAIARNFLDMRALPRENEPSIILKKTLLDKMSGNKNFMRGLAADFLSVAPPLSFFRNEIVEADGATSTRLDLENRLAEPIVDFARIMSFKYKITETNTLSRLKSLNEVGAISQGLFSEAMEAFEFQTQLILMNQLRSLAINNVPGYIIDPTDLTDLEKRTLKETFDLIGRFQVMVKEIFF